MAEINPEEFAAFCEQDEVLSKQKEALMANPHHDSISHFLNEIKKITLNERNQFVSEGSFYIWNLENIRIWVTQNPIPLVFWDDERQEYIQTLDVKKQPQTVKISKINWEEWLLLACAVNQRHQELITIFKITRPVSPEEVKKAEAKLVKFGQLLGLSPLGIKLFVLVRKADVWRQKVMLIKGKRPNVRLPHEIFVAEAKEVQKSSICKWANHVLPDHLKGGMLGSRLKDDWNKAELLGRHLIIDEADGIDRSMASEIKDLNDKKRLRDRLMKTQIFVTYENLGTLKFTSNRPKIECPALKNLTASRLVAWPLTKIGAAALNSVGCFANDESRDDEEEQFYDDGTLLVLFRAANVNVRPDLSKPENKAMLMRFGLRNVAANFTERAVDAICREEGLTDADHGKPIKRIRVSYSQFKIQAEKLGATSYSGHRFKKEALKRMILTPENFETPDNPGRNFVCKIRDHEGVAFIILRAFMVAEPVATITDAQRWEVEERVSAVPKNEVEVEQSSLANEIQWKGDDDQSGSTAENFKDQDIDDPKSWGG